MIFMRFVLSVFSSGPLTYGSQERDKHEKPEGH